MIERTRDDPGGEAVVLRLWRRIPIPVRAVLAGLFVFLVLQSGWAPLFMLNLELMPAVPWNVAGGLIWLWLVFGYFGGRGWPRSTAASRQRALRARRLTPEEWRTALPVCALLVGFIASSTWLSARLFPLPEEDMDLSALPWWSLYAGLIMLSVVAGVAEEAGFRGYMQGPLERRYGPVLAIVFTAVLFWVAHLNHPSGVARAPALILMGVALGTLAYCSRSILPAIVTHASVDTLGYTVAVGEIGPEVLWNPSPLAETGVDPQFVLAVVLTVGFAVGVAPGLRKLALSRDLRSNAA